MKKKEKIEWEVDQALNSLDNLGKATPAPYLFTRVKARMVNQEGSFWGKSLAFLSRPAVAFTTILLALFINGFIFFEFKSESPIASTGEGEQLFASEYNLENNTIYDSTIEP